MEHRNLRSNILIDAFFRVYGTKRQEIQSHVVVGLIGCDLQEGKSPLESYTIFLPALQSLATTYSISTIELYMYGPHLCDSEEGKIEHADFNLVGEHACVCRIIHVAALYHDMPYRELQTQLPNLPSYDESSASMLEMPVFFDLLCLFHPALWCYTSWSDTFHQFFQDLSIGGNTQDHGYHKVYVICTGYSFQETDEDEGWIESFFSDHQKEEAENIVNQDEFVFRYSSPITILSTSYSCLIQWKWRTSPSSIYQKQPDGGGHDEHQSTKNREDDEQEATTSGTLSLPSHLTTQVMHTQSSSHHEEDLIQVERKEHQYWLSFSIQML